MFKRTGRTGIAISILLATSVLAASSASANDDVVMMSISDGLATPDAQAKLDGSVKFYFGDAHHPGVEKTFGDLVTNDKTNSLGKSTIGACNWVFLSALLKFQERAHALGANAVINIRSFYKKEDFSSATQVQCHSGFLITGVALKGDFVKIR